MSSSASPSGTRVNLLLSSAGRRPYLVEWFSRAYETLGYTGRVVLADSDPCAPAKSFADSFELAPRATNDEYPDWLSHTLRNHEIDLAISVNDYELSVWSHLNGAAEFAPLISLDSHTQRVVEDKLLMADVLAAAGIAVPATTLANDADFDAYGGDEGIVIKGRFGSGSKGLRATVPDAAPEVIIEARREVTDRLGRTSIDQEHADSLLVAQPKIEGIEYGLDVIADLRGRHRGVLARRKTSMRHGETDQATTVDPGRFTDLGRAVTSAIPHRGLIDVDVIEDAGGRAWVIDVNPRFGGGYPFSHVAGADVPAAYLAWAAGLDARNDWLSSFAGVSAAKYVAIVATGENS